jgi:hypothetical protein
MLIIRVLGQHWVLGIGYWALGMGHGALVLSEAEVLGISHCPLFLPCPPHPPHLPSLLFSKQRCHGLDSFSCIARQIQVFVDPKSILSGSQ